MNQIVRILTLALLFAGFAHAQTSQPARTPAGDALLDVLVFGPHAAKIDPANYAGAIGAELTAYVARVSRLQSEHPPDPGGDASEETLHFARRYYEARLAAFSTDEAAFARASEYVDQLK